MSLKLPSGSTGVVIDVRVFNDTVSRKTNDRLLLRELKLSQYKRIKVEEEILNRNIKLRAIDLLNGQVISKQFKDLKPETTLNQNDFEKLSLKDLWKILLKNKN